MKILFSVGIELAQADISIDQAQSLGFVAYISFLKIKAGQQIAKLQTNQNNSKQQMEVGKCDSLLNTMDELLNELRKDILETNSINAFLRISESLENKTELDLNKYLVFDGFLQRIHTNAKEFVVDPRACFMNRIAATQSLCELSNFKSQLTSEAFRSQNSKNDVLILLNKLQTKSTVSKINAIKLSNRLIQPLSVYR
jgi:hypothetical protein